jgi:hemerythrin superfamily protein
MNTDGMTGAAADAVELLTSQHREVDQLWKQLQQSHRDGSDVQSQLSQEIVTRLSQHDAIETQFLYPELRKLGEQGRQLADHSLDEHQQVRELLSEVDGKDIRDENVFSTMARCLSAVSEHVEDEEHKAFPLMREQCGEERLMDLGHDMSDAMKMAPTHPHKHMPDSKVGAAVAGAVAGVADKARDAMSHKH